MPSFFSELDRLPEDSILSLPIAFAADTRPQKVNLGIGAYKTAEGASLVLTSVKKAEVQLVQKNLNKDYLPIEGDAEFVACSQQLLFGPVWNELKYLFSAQTVGGSGALRIAGEFLAKNVSRLLFLSQPSWPNHKTIFERSGLKVGSYPYYDPATHLIDFGGMCQAIKNMAPKSIILLQGCCHNPTGLDPNPEQWRELSYLIKKQQLFPLFDLAYQGFGQSLEKDADSIRLFAKEEHEMLVCYSFSKNFGLYGERVGLLTVVAGSAEAAARVGSQIKWLIRGNYSMPPLHGERIAKTILRSHELSLEWQIELQNMRERIKEMRTAFVAGLLAKGAMQSFSSLNQQQGLFSFCGLNPQQVERLCQEKGIYMPSNGRINIAGLNTQNLHYVVESILAVTAPKSGDGGE